MGNQNPDRRRVGRHDWSLHPEEVNGQILRLIRGVVLSPPSSRRRGSRVVLVGFTFPATSYSHGLSSPYSFDMNTAIISTAEIGPNRLFVRVPLGVVAPGSQIRQVTRSGVVNITTFMRGDGTFAAQRWECWRILSDTTSPFAPVSHTPPASRTRTTRTSITSSSADRRCRSWKMWRWETEMSAVSVDANWSTMRTG
jgi:hypothetical protein